LFVAQSYERDGASTTTPSGSHVAPRSYERAAPIRGITLSVPRHIVATFSLW
jgi:hypothetical protein